jgi:RimJ/RimL family protein N-acetyltransferase
MIYGKRVRFRAIERSDLPKYQEWLNDPEVIEGLSMYLPLSQVDEQQWFDQAMRSEPASRPLAIEIRQGEAWRLAGNIGFMNLEWNVRCAEFGIFIGDRSLWSNGYGTEAVQLLLRHGFGTLNLNRIYLRVHSTNARAIRSYEKAGFVLEGTLRQAVYHDGKYADMHVMSVLRSEWDSAREES